MSVPTCVRVERQNRPCEGRSRHRILKGLVPMIARNAEMSIFTLRQHIKHRGRGAPIFGREIGGAR